MAGEVLRRGTGFEDVPARPVRRVMIPKPNGGEQAARYPDHSRPGRPKRGQNRAGAATCLRRPRFRATLAYGYGPKRGAVDAVKAVHRHLCRGNTDTVDADVSKYLRFDSAFRASQIGRPACRGPQCAAPHQDVSMKAPIEERDRGRNPAHGRRQEKQSWHASGRRRKPSARQHLYEPVLRNIGVCPDAAKRFALTSSLMPMTSSSSAAVARLRRWRGQRR